jgi:hypothetical protein
MPYDLPPSPIALYEALDLMLKDLGNRRLALYLRGFFMDNPNGSVLIHFTEQRIRIRAPSSTRSDKGAPGELLSLKRTAPWERDLLITFLTFAALVSSGDIIL